MSAISNKVCVPNLRAIGFTGEKLGLFDFKIILKLNINNSVCYHDFLVLKQSHSFSSNIIGTDFMAKFQCTNSHSYNDPK